MFFFVGALVFLGYDALVRGGIQRLSGGAAALQRRPWTHHQQVSTFSYCGSLKPTGTISYFANILNIFEFMTLNL